MIGVTNLPMKIQDVQGKENRNAKSKTKMTAPKVRYIMSSAMTGNSFAALEVGIE